MPFFHPCIVTSIYRQDLDTWTTCVTFPKSEASSIGKYLAFQVIALNMTDYKTLSYAKHPVLYDGFSVIITVVSLLSTLTEAEAPS